MLTSPGGGLAKTFTLLERGLRVEYQISAESHRVQVPLSLDPWKRFTPGWGDRYHEDGSAQAWLWQMEGGPEVEVRTSATLSATVFSDSRPQLRAVEDPNYPYPPGHYLPFPMALVEVLAQQGFFVEITLIGER